MIIDAHVHAGRSDGLTHSWNTWADVEVTRRRMREAGIDKAVLLPIGSTNFSRRNRETAEIVKEYPGEFWGFAKVNQEEDRGRVGDMLEEAFGELGLRGLKLHGHPTREIMEVLAHHGKPLLVDVKGEVYPLRYVVESYPDVPVIVAHMGQFRSDEKAHLFTLWLAGNYENVYFDTSSVLEHEWLERAVEEGLCGKMIFGSDGPGLHCGVELARIRFLHLSPEDEEKVLWRNIARLLGEAGED